MADEALPNSDTSKNMSTGILTQYDAMRVAVAECARIDEAAEMRDKAAAIALYARQRDDTELEAWMAEIKLRACVRIGELSKDLDKATHGGSGGGSKVPLAGRSKIETLRTAGVSKSAAHRYEQAAADPALAEHYYEECRAEGSIPTLTGLQNVVRVRPRDDDWNWKREIAAATLKMRQCVQADPQERHEFYELLMRVGVNTKYCKFFVAGLVAIWRPVRH